MDEFELVAATIRVAVPKGQTAPAWFCQAVADAADADVGLKVDRKPIRVPRASENRARYAADFAKAGIR